MRKIEVGWQLEYDEENGALGLSKIKIRCRPDTNKIEVRWRQITMMAIVP